MGRGWGEARARARARLGILKGVIVVRLGLGRGPWVSREVHG